MPGLRRFFYAGLLAAGALIAAPQISAAEEGLGWGGTAGAGPRGSFCDGYGTCVKGGQAYDERDLRTNRTGTVRLRKTQRERPIYRDRDWDDDDGWRYRKQRRHYRSSPDVYIDLSIPSRRYVERRYVEPRYVPRRTIRLSEEHVAWCYDRWISYRDWDNTYQPFHGRRKQCYSPYS